MADDVDTGYDAVKDCIGDVSQHISNFIHLLNSKQEYLFWQSLSDFAIDKKSSVVDDEEFDEEDEDSDYDICLGDDPDPKGKCL